MTIKTVLAGTALAAGLAVSLMGTAQADGSRVQVGVLDCTVAGGTGFIIGSTKKLWCSFKKTDGSREKYSGTIRKYGIDIGSTDKTNIAWAVFAPSKKISYGALAGDYGGISAEATVGGGIGANALIGGSRKSFALQPFSVQTQTGLNIAAGIASLELRAR